MPAIIRVAVPEDAQRLPAIEISAAQAFRMIDGLSWLAESPPMSVEQHRQRIALSTCWVALNAENRPQGWGWRLVEAAKNYARANRLSFVTLTTFTSVPWNAPFYARLGFQIKATADLDQRLAAVVSEEYQHGFAPGSRCAMAWPVA